jgi:membrane protease YdiL (CAAX protease family)
VSVITLEQEIMPEPRRKLRWWHMFVPPVATAISLVFLVAIAIFANKIAIRSGYSVIGWAEAIQNFRHTKPGILISAALLYSILLAMMWLVLRKRGQLTFSGYFAPVRWNQVWKAALSGVLLAGLFIGTGFLLILMHAITPRHTAAHQLLMAHSIGQLIASLSVAALLGPLAEEIYFRGMLLSWLRQRLSWTYAATITAVLFALVHGLLFTQPLTAGIFFTAIIATLGYVNAMWLARTGSMWTPFTVHATYNGTIVLVASLGAMLGVK